MEELKREVAALRTLEATLEAARSNYLVTTPDARLAVLLAVRQINDERREAERRLWELERKA